MLNLKETVKLAQQVVIPEGVVGVLEEKQVFLAPWSYGHDLLFGVAKPPIHISTNNSWEMLIVNYSLYVHKDGSLFAEVWRNGSSSELLVERVTSGLKLLSEVWKWGLRIRKGQDRVVKSIGQVVGQEVFITEVERREFGLRQGWLKKCLSEQVKNFHDAGELLPDLSQVTVSSLRHELEMAWSSSQSGRSKNAANRGSRDEERRTRELKRERLLRENVKVMTAAYRKAGLL